MTDASSVVTDASSVMTDATSVVTDATSVVTDATSVVTDDSSVMTDASSDVTDHATRVTDEPSVVTDEATRARLQPDYHLDMRPGTALGQYLRARRGLVRPEEVGLMNARRRRVPGLRREELATLAGISSDYYLRLEQGRDHHPSAQVIEALARALRLDEHATTYLHSLSQPTAVRRHLGEGERAPASIERLIASWTTTPAWVHGRHMDTLAANALASALSPIFTTGVNLVRAIFLDPGVRTLWRDWASLAEAVVARLRVLVGGDLDDPRLGELVAELSVRSDEFRRLWERQDIQVPTARPTIFDHPLVGTLELQPERLAILGTEGQLLIVCHAEPGSPSEQRLVQLARIAAGNL